RRLVESVCQSPAVDVQIFQDLQHRSYGQTPVHSPEDDIEIFLSGFETIENAIEKKGVVVRLAVRQAEISSIKLDPKTFALYVLQLARSPIATPVSLDSRVNSVLAQVM